MMIWPKLSIPVTSGYFLAPVFVSVTTAMYLPFVDEMRLFVYAFVDEMRLFVDDIF